MTPFRAVLSWFVLLAIALAVPGAELRDVREPGRHVDPAYAHLRGERSDRRAALAPRGTAAPNPEATRAA